MLLWLLTRCGIEMRRGAVITAAQIAHLQQYEMMYREWRMKAEKLDSDIATLQVCKRDCTYQDIMHVCIHQSVWPLSTLVFTLPLLASFV